MSAAGRPAGPDGMGEIMDGMGVTQLRVPRTVYVVVLTLAICASPAALSRPWLPILYLIPLTVGLWAARAGVDVDSAGLTVRAMIGRRRFGWDRVAGFRVAPRGDVRLVLREGSEVRLPVVRARHLRVLAEASGGRFDAP